MKKRSQSAGFTLMEVVVAISLMTLIMAILFMGMRITANGVRRGEQKLQEHARLMSGSDVIERQVADAVPWTGTVNLGLDKKPTSLVAFSASSQEVRFVSRTSWRGDRTRPQYMADYRVVRRDGQDQLMVSETPLTDDVSIVASLQATPDNRVAAAAIGDPADAIDIAYYRIGNAQTPSGWVFDWQPAGEKELPRALRVRWTRGRDSEVATYLIAINREPKVGQ